MDGCMQHHGSSNRHDGPDGTLCLTILMVGAYTRKVDYLGEFGEMSGKLLGGEGLSIVR
jgi:hypothetical protein